MSPLLQKNEVGDRHREMREAGEIQQRLLPAPLTEIAGLAIALHWKPARTLGGDYFDVLRFQDGSVGLAIGDVEGKGVPAALVMASLQAAVRTLATPALPPRELVRRLNDLFCHQLRAERCISLFYAHLDPGSGRLAYSNAGHLPPLHVREDGGREALSEGGVLLGRLPGRAYRQGEVALRSGDRLVLYTDGVSEAASAGEEEFGAARLGACAGAAASSGAAELKQRLLAALAAHCGGRPGRDDATLAILEVRGQAASARSCAGSGT